MSLPGYRVRVYNADDCQYFTVNGGRAVRVGGRGDSDWIPLDSCLQRDSNASEFCADNSGKGWTYTFHLSCGNRTTGGELYGSARYGGRVRRVGLSHAFSHTITVEVQ